MLKPKLLPGLHGVRFLAAISIVFFHMRGIALAPPPEAFGWITDKLGHGVRLFFVLSAFSLMYSTTPSMGQPDWIRSYVLKRFFRIAPVFYTMIILMTAGHYLVNDIAPDPREIVLNLTFMFPFLPDQMPSLVLGAWTIGVEMIFYALLPIILALVPSWRSALFLTIGALVVAEATKFAPASSGLPTWTTSMAFTAHIPFFAAGVLSYFSYRMSSGLDWDKAWPIAAIIVVVGIAGLLWSPGFHTSQCLQVVTFGVLCTWQANRPSRILASRLAVYWGERSYGIYLMHMPTMVLMRPAYGRLFEATGTTFGYFLSLTLTLGLTLILADILYRCIERPGIELGRTVMLNSASGGVEVHQSFR